MLTPAERRVVIALALDYSQKEVAVLYGISPITVHRQIASVYAKAGGGGLIRLLLLLGWLKVPDE